MTNGNSLSYISGRSWAVVNLQGSETEKPGQLDYSAKQEKMDWLNASCKCKHCGSDEVAYREQESSDGGHVDCEYFCHKCARTWWVDGVDA